MSHIGIHAERNIKVLPESELITERPVDRRIFLTQEHFILLIVNRCAIFFIVSSIVVHYFRITRALSYLSSFCCLISLPDTIHLIIPDSTNGLSNKPTVACVVHLFATNYFSSFIEHVFIFIIKMLDFILIE